MNMAGKQVMPEDLSALVDGEVDALSAAALSEAWRHDAESRARWHRYQFIGDVLRSPELAGAGRDAAFLASLRGRLAQEPVVLAPMGLPLEGAGASAAAGGGVVAESGAGAGVLGAFPGAFGRAGWVRSIRPRAAVRRWASPAALAAGFLVVAVGSLTLLRPPVPAGSVIAATAPASASTALAGPASTAGAPTLAAATVGGLPVPLAQTADASLGAGLPERATGPMIRDARLDGYLAAHKQFGGSSALGVPSGFLRNATHEGSAALGGR